MHWELFATCSNIIKFQNRLTARGANCSFYFKQQQQQRLALSLSLSDCLTVSSRLCCAKLIIQTEQNSSSSRAPWIILINPAWDSISYTSIAIEMSWACKLCNERRSPALSAFSLTHTLVLSLFLSFFDCFCCREILQLQLKWKSVLPISQKIHQRKYHISSDLVGESANGIYLSPISHYPTEVRIILFSLL